MNLRRPGVAWCVLLPLAALLSACGIATDDAPRDIPAARQVELGVDTDRPVGAATGTARIFLLTPQASGKAQSLVPAARDVDETPNAVLVALLAGPNTVELAAQLRTAIPAGTEVLSSTLRGGILRVDVSSDLLQLSGEVLVGAIAQIVFTVAEIDGVRSVKILVDGEDQQWPAGNGELQEAPLTVYDYPGLLASAQPDYPAIPTPG